MTSGIGGPGGGGKIGGPGGKPPAGSVDATRPSERAEKPFGDALGKAEGAKPAGQVGPLERLRAGELDLHGYLDVKVHEATAHLEGVLPASDIEKIRDELRDLLAEDPDVAAFARGVDS